MYRILIAVNGYYYVQRQSNLSGRWLKVGPFFRTRRGARNYINDYRSIQRLPNVVEYV